MKNIVFLIVLLVVATVNLNHLAADNSQIKKCKDAKGTWHYGDFAAQECGRSIVTQIDEQGVKRLVEYPPPSRQELARREREAAKVVEQEKEKELQYKKDQKFLYIQGSEDVITSTRDRKLATMDKTIAVTRKIKMAIESDYADLASRQQTAKVRRFMAERKKALQSYDRVIKQNLAERVKLEKKYAQIIAEFHAVLKRRQNRTL